MTGWLIWSFVALAVAGVVTVLMRHPGAVLYDWLATRARTPAPASMKPRAEKKHQPVNQFG